MSVVIPAHDEAPIIRRLLSRLIETDQEMRLQIVVVANGCTDGTARAAASVSPRIVVVEISETSKIDALNAGDKHATVFPRAYVDADVQVDAPTLLALAEGLGDATPFLVASPHLVTSTAKSSWPVRQYYKVWALSDFRTEGHIGSGVYAVSGEGRKRWGTFPDVIADDRFVQQQFDIHERLTLAADHAFVVEAPRDFATHIRRSTRIEAGNQQLPASLQQVEQVGARTRYGHLVRRVARSPRLWAAFPVYCVGYLVPRLRARRALVKGTLVAWNRDEASRADAAR
ncbi:glycosyltransferase [soil metagenome]